MLAQGTVAGPFYHHERRMHVAMSLLTLFPGKAGGTETIVRALVRELPRMDAPERVTLLTTPRVAAALAPTELPMHTPGRYRDGESAPARLGAVAAAALLPRIVAADVPPGLDVIHYPVTIPIPRAGNAASVVSLHDMQHHELPQFFSAPERLFRRFAYDGAARRADRVVTLSEHARGQIVERLGIPAERIDVAHCGVDHERFRPEPTSVDDDLELPERFVLYPANLWPHKNHERLLRAFDRARPAHTELVLTGQTYGRPLPPGPAARVRHLGLLPSEQLPAVYRRATAVVFPSLFEGFGMPPIEAMASGTPVAVSDRGAMAEACGDAALRFDPEDVDAIAAAIGRIVEDGTLRATLRELGLARAATFRWDRFAGQHVAAYREALASRRDR
jgi:glycosyltransferase involved in cell wall biosynthesis